MEVLTDRCSGRVQKQGRQHHGRGRPGRLDRGAPSRDARRQEDVGGQKGKKGQSIKAGRYALKFRFARPVVGGGGTIE